MTAPPANPMLRLMPREMRMMTERAFSLTGLPKGFFLMVQDVVMYSHKLGFGGFALLERRSPSLKGADPARVTIASEYEERLTLDGGNQHAWFVIPAIIDLLGELVHRHGRARLTVTNVADPEELRVAAALAARNGLAVAFTDGPQATFSAAAAITTGKLEDDEPLLWDLLQNGLPVDAELWWRVYGLAQKALAPDSVVSRRHAGPVIVNDDGSIIGRKDSDDETDLSFLITPLGSEPKKESVGP
jgi:hypothetical protein